MTMESGKQIREYAPIHDTLAAKLLRKWPIPTKDNVSSGRCPRDYQGTMFHQDSADVGICDPICQDNASSGPWILPPEFLQGRNSARSTDQDGTIQQEMQDFDPVPIIDLQCLDLDKLGVVCKDWGLFHLVNHDVPLTLLSQLQDHAIKLFSLSFESKQARFTSPVSYFWGTPALTPSGAPLSTGPQNVNWVEGLNVPLKQLSQFEAEDPMLDAFRF
ncbi:unnamed protein product [Dovyalis caffra]|uniref:Non-haem dioxygenase N-terminal domain-containing protein n=1 Tax=Dovyalis caffra TaxID=77055 RepID=A0AAV1RCM0_9ROSI|nr:unnamed protein product [Dovyalis caffra]